MEEQLEELSRRREDIGDERIREYEREWAELISAVEAELSRRQVIISEIIRADERVFAAIAAEQARIHEGGAWIDCARHAAEAVPEGQAIAGPAVIEGYTATTYVPPGWTASIDAADNMVLRRVPGGAGR